VHKLVYAAIAVALVVTFAAAIVAGFRLHHSAAVERQTIRTLSLQSAALAHRRASARDAYANLSAHDAGEGRRLRAAYLEYLRAPSDNAPLLEAVQTELSRQSDAIHSINPAARRSLVVSIGAAVVLVLTLVWLFELERRSGRIDRDHAARADELIRLRDEFVAVVSHELRTPMTSIVGYVELLAEDDVLTPEQRSYLEVVQRGCDRLVEIVDELLLVAEAGRGKLALELVDVDGATLVANAVAAARPAADGRGIDLRSELGAETTLHGDAKRLGQMLDNLVSNAIKFTPEGGRVCVRTGRAAGGVFFEVSDTGDGIPPEDREHLFEAFYRSRSSNAQAVPGTGLGLTITKAIVDAHHGTIAVECPDGAGTTFRVVLPAGTE
jgi:signal transduction histidine kinase